MIEVADAAGFPSTNDRAIGGPFAGEMISTGAGVVPYLIDRFEAKEIKHIALLAYIRFNAAVHTGSVSEAEKVKVTKRSFDDSPVSVFENTRLTGSNFLYCLSIGGGPKGVLGDILRLYKIINDTAVGF